MLERPEVERMRSDLRRRNARTTQQERAKQNTEAASSSRRSQAELRSGRIFYFYRSCSTHIHIEPFASTSQQHARSESIAMATHASDASAKSKLNADEASRESKHFSVLNLSERKRSGRQNVMRSASSLLCRLEVLLVLRCPQSLLLAQ